MIRILLTQITLVAFIPAVSADIISDLMIHMDFETSNFDDKSGNHRHGVGVNAPTFSLDTQRSSTVVNVTPTAYGEIAENGTTANHPTGSAARTYAIWAKQNSFVNDAGIWHSGGVGANTADFSLEQFSTPGTMSFNGWNADFDFTIPGNINDWHHFTVTYDGSTIIAYVDAQERGRLAASLGTHNNPILIGGPRFNSNRVGADASLDEFRIYSRAFTPSEVNELYTFIPEPGSMGLILLGAGLLTSLRRR